MDGCGSTSILVLESKKEVSKGKNRRSFEAVSDLSKHVPRELEALVIFFEMDHSKRSMIVSVSL
jgi:hypothetical protein